LPRSVTVRLIAEQVLPPALRKCTCLRGELWVQQVIVREPRAPYEFHVYCSPKNAGADKLLDELCSKYPAIKGVKIEHERARCERMLLYLRRDVWSRGEVSSALRDEVAAVLNDDPQRLLLCHEMPGIDEEKRHGFEFDVLFRGPPCGTPQTLLEGGVYNTMIAVPMKGGMWRPVSLAMLAKTIAVEMQVPPTAGTQRLSVARLSAARLSALRQSMTARPMR
jgi:hypothetical protein